MTCKSGDLVLIPFPYADLSSSKKRPVLVLTPPDRHGDFIALAVTSLSQVDQAITLEKDDLIQGALPRKSWVRLDKVFILASTSIVKTFGSVTASLVQNSVKGVCTTLR